MSYVNFVWYCLDFGLFLINVLHNIDMKFFLPKAHERQRRAEALLREGRFEEAAKCHETVASLLAEAHAQLESRFARLKTSNLSSQTQPIVISSFHSFITLESLALQCDYHKRQAAVVR